MRIVLEKQDLINIIGKYLEATLDASKVVVRTDPFEVEVTGVPLPDAAAPVLPVPPTSVIAPTPPPAQSRTEGPFIVTPPELPPEPSPEIIRARADRGATLEVPPPGRDGFDSENSEFASPAGIIATSRALQEKLDRENPGLVAQQNRLKSSDHGPIGSDTMPPFTENES
jgi:hypothetical protein